MNKNIYILAVLAAVLIAGPTFDAVAEVMPWVEFKPIAPVTVDVEDIGLFALITQSSLGQIIFEFHNESQIQSAISSIYFENYALDGVADIQTPDNVFFEEDRNPANFPGGANLEPTFNTAFSIGADPSPVSNGINPGEQLKVTIDLDFGTSYSDIINGLTKGDIRIGMHVIALSGGSSFSVLNSVVSHVPEPATLGLLGMGTLFLFRSHKKQKS